MGRLAGCTGTYRLVRLRGHCMAPQVAVHFQSSVIKPLVEVRSTAAGNQKAEMRPTCTEPWEQRPLGLVDKKDGKQQAVTERERGEHTRQAGCLADDGSETREQERCGVFSDLAV